MRPVLRNALFTTIALVACLVAFSLFSFHLKKSAESVWEQLGMNEDIGLGNVQSLFLEGYFYQLNARPLKNIGLLERKNITLSILNETKKYLYSPSFKEDYDWYRKEKKPSPPEPARTKLKIREELIKETEETIAENKAMMEGLNEDQIKAFEAALQKLDDMVRDYRDEDNPTVNILYEGEVNQYKERMRTYQENVREFEEYYPEDINLMISDRLTLFLDLTDDMNYDAALKTEYGHEKICESRL